MRNLSEARAIAKKMKYGHLQKLKWYCEICQHQCNDEQSYRQHVQCEKHRGLMLHFKANSASILKQNSYNFECTFMNVLKRMFSNREVLANVVYTQVIRDKKHVHMNSTYWESVHGFCCHLEKTGKITMRMTERGPMIRYVQAEEVIMAKEKKECEMIRQMQIEREREVLEAMTRQSMEVQEPPRAPAASVEVQPIEVTIKAGNRSSGTKVASIFGGSCRPKAKQ